MDEQSIDLNLIRKVLEISDLSLFPLYIKEVYRDLIDRAESNKKQGVSRITFYEYIKLPVLIADKLFNALDKDNDGFLSLKEFVDGLNNLYYGSFKHSAKIIFNMYDFDRDGVINRDDIKILFSYLPLKNEEKQMESLKEINSILNEIKIESHFTFKKFIETVENVKSDIYLQLLCFLYEHRPFSIENVEVCKYLPKYKEQQISNEIESEGQFGSPPVRHKSSILSETVTLSSPSKSTMFKPVDNLINMLQIDDFNLDTENEVKVKLPTRPTKGTSKKFSTSDIKSKDMIRIPNQREFIDENVNNTPSKFLKKEAKNPEMEDLKLSSPIKKKSSVLLKSSEQISKCGPIFKITESKNIKQYYLKLYNKDIYYYKNEKCNELMGMHNLSGCFVSDVCNETIDNREFYSFTIIFSNKTRAYYVDSQTSAISWVSTIKKGIGYQSFNDSYEMNEKTLGEGKFGLVKLGVHKKTGQNVAIKIIKKQAMAPKDQELVKSEIDIMKMCRQKNIVRILDHFEDNDFIFIVMEYLAGGTLAHYLESTPVDALSEKDTGVITYQIAKALEYLHEFGIIHRDLKPENIMIKGILPYEGLDSLKVMDFGLSKILGPSERVNDGYGTLTYVAPEVLTRKPYNKHVDIWSLGVIVYYTLSGAFPFDDSSNDEEVIAKKTVFNELKFFHKSWPSRSASVRDFIIKALTKDLEKRATIAELLAHQWFTDCEITTTVKKAKKASSKGVDKAK